MPWNADSLANTTATPTLPKGKASYPSLHAGQCCTKAYEHPHRNTKHTCLLRSSISSCAHATVLPASSLWEGNVAQCETLLVHVSHDKLQAGSKHGPLCMPPSAKPGHVRTILLHYH